jgi:REP element-mobilizing transposase RayT
MCSDTQVFMTQARSHLISVEDTPYYHCVSRCVRKAFLCGSDGKQCFEHRRDWVVQRIKTLAATFAIDVAAYAVMSNHYHLVLRIDSEQPHQWSQKEVIVRWLQLFKAPDIVKRHINSPLTTSAELAVVDDIIETWRERLGNISWFMKCLNEHIARKANLEDKCTGHFWEARFKSQALLDKTAVLTCMAYVDLNPIRAQMAKTPETSDFTSIQERLGILPNIPDRKNTEPLHTEKPIDNPLPLTPLLAFAGNEHQDNNPKHLPFHLTDYFELVDWTGRCVRNDKRGAIPTNLPNILIRLGLDQEQWLKAATGIECHFHKAIGPVNTLKQLAERFKQQWLQGKQACLQLYPQ